MKDEEKDDEYLVVSWWGDPKDTSSVGSCVTVHAIKEEAGLEYARRKGELKKYQNSIIKMAKTIL